MKKLKIYIIVLIFLCLVIAITGLLVKMMESKNTLDTDTSVWSEWNEVLVEGESIIDGVQDNTIAYLLTSSEGHKQYGDFLIVAKKENSKWNRIYENDFEDLRPWKIKLADVDGDGTKEIITAVYKKAHYDSVYKNRLFLFNFEKGVLTKMWTGSQFPGEWNDFYVENLLNIPGEELIFIEQVEEKAEKISIYYWFDFGFLKLAESESYQDIISLFIIDENRIQITYDNLDLESTAVLTVKAGEIVEIEGK